MDVESTSAAVGGRRRRTRNRRKGSNGVAADTSAIVEKESASIEPSKPVATSASSTATATVSSSSGPSVAAKTQQIVLEKKKKPTKLVLVPRGRRLLKKTFKARRIRMHIDNTPKTMKRTRQFRQRIDGMSDAQVREAVVVAKLARAETVARAPGGLLREMLRDYHSLRGGLF